MAKSIERLLDANFNRAREALRVLEDYARFLLNDATLSGAAKALRHELTTAMAQIGVTELLGARDTLGDVGTVLSTDQEKRRRDSLVVVLAASRRLSEALRCLEEYSKIRYGDLAAALEQIRYRAYELEKTVLTRANREDRFRAVQVYVLLTESACQRPILQVAEAVLEGGADCIQLREKQKADAELVELARIIAQMCHDAGALFVMNDRADLAVLANADGVHVGQDDLSVEQVRKVVGGHVCVGKSSHSVEEARAAQNEGCDYLAVGSVFASQTKPQVAVSGLELIQQVRDCYQGPVIAIGGVTPENASQAVSAGASGVALSQAVLGAADPAEQVRRLKAVFDQDG